MSRKAGTTGAARDPLRRRLTMHRTLFTLLALCAAALLALLSERHQVVVDWTRNARNTLSPASRAVLGKMPGPIEVTAFVNDDRQLREALRQLLERYQREHPRLTLELVNPELEPRRAAEAGIEGNGALLIRYQQRNEKVTALSERSVSSALNRLARADQRWIAYLAGNGERDLLGQQPRDLGRFGKHLQSLGFKLRPLALGTPDEIPDNVTLLVVLEPRAALPQAVPGAIRRFLETGGNLLWLSDASPHPSLAPLEPVLGVAREDGLLVDPKSRLSGRATPEFISVAGYAQHAVTGALDGASVFPTATSLRWQAPPGWRAKGLAASSLTSWLETGDLNQAVRFDDGADTPGPLDLAVALEREGPAGAPQRVVVFGDADFLSNAYLGLAVNRTLGSATVSWLAHDDGLVDVPVLMAPDLDFAPSAVARAVIALGAPLGLPVIVFAVGLVRWRRRRMS